MKKKIELIANCDCSTNLWIRKEYIDFFNSIHEIFSTQIKEFLVKVYSIVFPFQSFDMHENKKPTFS
jgi:hypothetical protein